MSERQELISFLIPWTGGMVAAWGDLSPVGILWGGVVAYVSIVAHERFVRRSTPNQAEAGKP